MNKLCTIHSTHNRSFSHRRQSSSNDEIYVNTPAASAQTVAPNKASRRIGQQFKPVSGPLKPLPQFGRRVANYHTNRSLPQSRHQPQTVASTTTTTVAPSTSVASTPTSTLITVTSQPSSTTTQAADESYFIAQNAKLLQEFLNHENAKSSLNEANKY